MPPRTAPRPSLLLEAAGWANVGKTNLHEFAYGVTSQNLHYGTSRTRARPERPPAARAAARRPRSSPALADARARHRHRAARSASRPRAAASPGSSRRYGLVADRRRLPARAELRPRRADGARRRGLRRADARARPGFERRAGRRSADVCGIADRSCGRRAPARASGRSSSRPPRRVAPAFMREVGDVHRELYAEHARALRREHRGKIERCLALTDAEYAAAQRARGRAPRSGRRRRSTASTCSSTPMLSCPSRRPTCDELEVRAAMTLFTFPFNALGWPGPARVRERLPDRRRRPGRRTRSCSPPGSRSKERSRPRRACRQRRHEALVACLAAAFVLAAHRAAGVPSGPTPYHAASRRPPACTRSCSAPDEPPQPVLPAHAVVRVDAGAAQRRQLRLRARDQQDVRRLVDRLRRTRS